MVPILPPNTTVIGVSWLRNFKAGDVVIFRHDGKEKIKRVQEVLGDGGLFVIGEHPQTSKDSRQFGAIDPDTVLARIIWPNVYLT